MTLTLLLDGGACINKLLCLLHITSHVFVRFLHDWGRLCKLLQLKLERAPWQIDAAVASQMPESDAEWIRKYRLRMLQVFSRGPG